MKKSRLRLLTLVIPCAILIGGLQAGPISLGVNAIVNGDAESSVGSTDGSVVALPGWTISGNLTAVQYDSPGGFPSSIGPGPVSRGSNFFAGGPSIAFSSGTQLLDVSNIASQIDAGAISFLLSGYLGGFETQADNATFAATFLNAANASIGSSAIGPVTPANRGNATGLLLAINSGTLPIGTRSISFTLSMTRLEGSYDDGYADSLSFIATSTAVPEPATVISLMMGLGALACWKRRVSI